jgi:hypothetical protein
MACQILPKLPILYTQKAEQGNRLNTKPRMVFKNDYSTSKGNTDNQYWKQKEFSLDRFRLFTHAKQNKLFDSIDPGID